MRRTLLVIIALIVAALAVVVGNQILSSRQSARAVSGSAVGAAISLVTPADGRIRKAEIIIKTTPYKAEGYNLLAAAYMQKARETGDFGLNAKAEAALKRSAEIAPDNLDVMNLHATLLVTYHRFSEALDVARRARQLRPDNPDLYGPLTDALVELGNYKEAIEATQKMMDLRPDGPSYARTSYLRALHGDTEGAIEAMQVAIRSASARDPEAVAWYRVNFGNALMNVGKVQAAEREYDSALNTFPDYHLALAAKARARAIAGDYEAAIEFFRKAQQRVPLSDTAIALGDLYAKLGRSDESKRQYEMAEFIEQAEASGGAFGSRQIALFWADHDMRLKEALEIMRRERAARSDIYTCDALAWCLFKNGELAQAKAAIDEALKLGTRDALIYYHAGLIYGASGDRVNSRSYLKRALEARVSFNNSTASFGVLQAEAAKRALESN